MPKKNKKRIQKKKQNKALKQRTQRKLKKKSTPKRRSMFPGNLPPGAISGDARKMMTFAEPLAAEIDPGDMMQVQVIGQFIQGLWQGFGIQDPEERSAAFEPLRPLFEEFDWARCEFDEFLEYMLKRHIATKPEAHTEQEAAQFTPDQLEEAMASPLPGTEPGQDEGDITADADGPAVDVSEDSISVDLAEKISFDFAADKATALVGEAPFGKIVEMRDQLNSADFTINFHDAEDVGRQTLVSLHKMLIELFLAYINDNDVDTDILTAHRTNISPFLNTFLIEKQRKTLSKTSPDDCEEYLLDYYLRVVTRDNTAEEQVLNTLQNFFEFAQSFELIKDSSEFSEEIDDLIDEYRDLLANEREAAEQV